MITSHDPLESVAGAERATEQIEMAFVPAPERQRPASAAVDAIVTVGQRGQQKKKRKRNVVSSGPEAGAEVFDYTAEPSLLDVSEVKRVGPVAKKRNKGMRDAAPYWQSTLTSLARTSTGAVWKLPGSPQTVQSTEEREPVTIISLIRTSHRRYVL